MNKFSNVYSAVGNIVKFEKMFKIEYICTSEEFSKKQKWKILYILL